MMNYFTHGSLPKIRMLNCFWATIFIFLLSLNAGAQTFIHPGGLHTIADLDRMKAKVAAGEHPWIDDWNKLITDGQAQNTYTAAAAAQANMGVSRQRADADAHAAYLNAIRWYISGDTSYAACARKILNAWAYAVNQVPSGNDISGLGGIPIFDFALAAEVLRIYPNWSPTDFAQFKSMMTTYFYPLVHNYLTTHNGACVTHYWANWDICNIGALITMGVLCDDTAIFNEGVQYFKNGVGSGSITNAVPYLHSPTLGQWQESGRDQEHAQLGVGMMGYLCQVAWNQGVDLFGYDNNRLLAGAEYVAKTNLSQPVPFAPYNNCDNVNHRWVAINGLGRLDDRPVWELLYNHYVVKQGLSAPNIQAMAQVIRPEHGSIDHFGYGTLTFTLDAASSPYPPSPVPSAPTGVTATAGTSRITINWNVPNASTVQGYSIQRANTSGGPYTTIATWSDNTYPQYTDNSVTNGTNYYYVVATNNQSGTSAHSIEVSATPMSASSTLPTGWSRKDIGNVGVTGSAGYVNVSNNTFVTSGAGIDIGGTSDGLGFTYGIVSGDVTITARVYATSGARKTGVMIRESLDPNAKAFIMKIGDAGGREAGFGMRTTTGGSMSWIGGNAYTWLPAWFRLQRSGNTITAYESSDGVNWFVVGSTTVSMNNVCYVGLVNCSGNTTALNTTTFDNVTIVGAGTTTPNAPTGLSAIPGNTTDTLSWNAVSGASAYTLKRSTTSGGPYTTVVNNLNSTSYVDTALQNGTTYYYVATAANFGGESANSNEVSVTPQLAKPLTPVNVTAKSVSSKQINLSWAASLSAATYNVKRATANGGPYISIASVTETSYSDSTLTDTLTRYYVISAVNEKGESPNSSQVKASPERVAYWSLDESVGTTAADSWSSYHGTLSSGVTQTTGAINTGAKFDGTSNSYITLPTGLLSSINDFTFSAWVRMDVGANWSRIFDFGNNTNVYMYLGRANTGVLRYAITTSSGPGEQGINSNISFPIGTWTHVAVTWSENKGTLYINGNQVGQNTNMSLNPSSLGNTLLNWLGRSQWSGDPRFTGMLDEVQIYNRALSSSEINNLSQLTAPASISAVSVSSTQINLSWNPSTNATSYLLKRSTVSGGPYTTIAFPSGTTYNDAGLTPNTTYYYVISALHNNGETDNSSETKATAGLLSYWKFDETSDTITVDDAGNNDGILAGGATWTTGYQNNSIRLDGNSGYVKLPGNLMSSINDFTIATWIKMDAHASWMRVFDFGSGTNNYLFLTTQAGTVSGQQVIRYAIKNGGGEQQVSYNYSLPLNTWAHFAVTQSGNTCSLFINGALVAMNTNVTIKPANLGSTTQNYIGKSQWPDPLFKGSIDEFKIYCKALTASEIAELFKKEQTITFNPLTQKKVSDDDFNAGAIASSGLPITYTSSDESVATIVNGMIHIVGKGVTIVTASQNGDNTYKAAPSVSQQLTVYMPPMVITRNITAAVEANGNVSTTPQQVDDGSVSYSGALSLSLSKTEFNCSDIGSPIAVTLTATDADGHSSVATAQVTVIDSTKPLITAPSAQFFCYSDSGSYAIPSLNASDNCGIASVRYSINGATSRSGSGTDASGSFNVGESAITWEVTDVHGNVSTATTTVAVNPAIIASIPGVYAMNSAVDAKNTLYLGYGPTSLTVTAIASGGTEPYSYQWNTGETTQSKLVSTAGISTATITDSKGCSTTASIAINVLDVRCGNNNDKVMICHNNNSICVASAAVQEHLNHGDYLGGCHTSSVALAREGGVLEEATSYSVVVYPNPVSEVATIKLSKLEAGATVQLYNANGTMVLSQRLTNATQAISLKGLAAGMYYVQVRNGNQQMSQKIIKQ